jgi:hypothetical protein
MKSIGVIINPHNRAPYIPPVTQNLNPSHVPAATNVNAIRNPLARRAKH